MSLKSGKSCGCFDLRETTFLVKQVKWGQIVPKSFAPQNEPHTAKLSISGVLKHFSQRFKQNLSLRTKTLVSHKED